MTRLLAALACFILMSCGKDVPAGACASSPFVGSWTEVAGHQTLVVSASCQAKIDYCGYSFVMPATTEQVQSFRLTITQTNGNSGCLGLGDHSCQYTMDPDGNRLGFGCEGSLSNFQKGNLNAVQ